MKPELTIQDDGSIIMENHACRVLVEPGIGSKIRSFYSKKTGTEYLFTDPRKRFTGPGFSDCDISGIDECFPTVLSCAYPHGKLAGVDLGDHGLLWDKQWTWQIDQDRLTMICDLPQIGCTFSKTCHLSDDGAFRIDYEIHNHADESFKYLYCLHALLAAMPGTRFLFPQEMQKIYPTIVEKNPALIPHTSVSWPPPLETGFHEPLAASHVSVLKCYSDRLVGGRAGITHQGSDEALVFEFDVQHLPYLGVLIIQGFDNGDENFRDLILLGLEPSSGREDDLLACEANGTVGSIAPGGKIEFWIRLKLLSPLRATRRPGPIAFFDD